MQRVANEVGNMFDASIAEKFLQNVKSFFSFSIKLNLQYVEIYCQFFYSLKPF